jgi:polysaccharide biosynthesis transport protein
MHRSHTPTITPADVIRILRENPRRWIVPTVAFGVLALGYAVLRSPVWSASQALMVRDEAIGTAARPGKFQQPEEMKTVQETILELVRSRAVLGAALAEVGLVNAPADASWPSDAAINALQARVKLTPPKGAEFGKTEVFYLNVEAESRERATKLAGAICKQLQARSQDLRDQKAQSLIAELTKTVDLAQADLTKTTNNLLAVETKVGADLGELRVLNEMGGGDSQLRRSINEMELELRQARQATDANKELLTMLSASKEDAKSLVTAPNRLLEAQPVLRRLKDGLVDAQLRTAQLEGNLTEIHPAVIAAQNSEREVAEHVRGELDAAVLGVQAELRLSEQRISLLENELEHARHRLANLAGMRATYANVVAERNQRADIVKSAEQQLAEARASQAAAKTASLIAAIDAPIGSDTPVGPGKASLLLAGLIGGFVVGLGIVFLTVHPVYPAATIVDQVAVAAGFAAELPVQKPAIKTAAGSDRGFNGFAIPQLAMPTGSLSVKQALWKLAGAR